MRVRRTIAAAMALVTGLAAAPVAAAAEKESFPVYTGDQFNELFTAAPLGGLSPVGPARR